MRLFCGKIHVAAKGRAAGIALAGIGRAFGIEQLLRNPLGKAGGQYLHDLAFQQTLYLHFEGDLYDRLVAAEEACDRLVAQKHTLGNRRRNIDRFPQQRS